MSIFGIIEINDSKKELVHLVESKDDFLNYIKNQSIIEYTLLENLAYSDFIKSKTFKLGKYLLVNENKASYIEKETVPGIVYGTKLNFKTITEWEIVPIKADINEFKKEKFEGFESKEALVIAKFDMLKKLQELEQNYVIKLSQTYDINSSYKAMKYEYDLWNKIIDDQMYEQLDENLDKIRQVDEELQGYVDDDTTGIDSYEQMTNIDFPEFTTICMIGRRATGKSTAICNFLDKYTEEFIQNTLIIAPTEKLNPMYKYKYPNAKVVAHYTPELVDEFLHYGPGAIILDDCFNAKADLLNDEVLMELFFNAKSYNKLLIITMQYSLRLSPSIRSNFDYVMFFREEFYANEQRTHDHYADMFASFDSFRNLLLRLTHNYSCMVLNMGWKENFNDRICWYNAIHKEKQE